ncbi:hypothetical protein BOTCAL_0244g00090 [Botryotinia calthae]|uniref:Uncharacterized protein n=1 Tax=Botryotinia calthae TaxID=38488 RepID=A0A4Y8CZH6_9HELO|nr:hypothetical protein BOTCAL_0244g00090 [Botryotinia calthae]
MSKRSANDISMDEGQFPRGWNILNEAMLQATCFAEAKVWCMAEKMCRVSAFELLPADEIWDFTALTKEPKDVHPVTEALVDNTNWSAQFPQKLVTILHCPVFAGQYGLSILRHAIKFAKWCRQKRGIVIDGSDFLLPPKPILEVLKEGEVEPDHLDFLYEIEEAAYVGNKEKTGVSGTIIHRDSVTIENAWENYVLNWKRDALLQQRREAEAVNGEQDDGEGEDGEDQEEREEGVEEELEVAEDLEIFETVEEDATNNTNRPSPVTPRTCHATHTISVKGFNPVSPIHDSCLS